MYKNMECVFFKVQLKDGCLREEKCGRSYGCHQNSLSSTLFEGINLPIQQGLSFWVEKVFSWKGILLWHFQSGVDISDVRLFPTFPDGCEGSFVTSQISARRCWYSLMKEKGFKNF